MDVTKPRHVRCEAQPAAGARVRLLRTRQEAVAEGTLTGDGKAELAVDTASLRGDAVYAVEVDGVITGYVEIPAAGKPLSVAAPP